MKKEILEALTTKFPGVSVSILDRIATKLAETVTTAEQVKTAVEGVTIQQVIESYGDSRGTEALERCQGLREPLRSERRSEDHNHHYDRGRATDRRQRNQSDNRGY